MAADDRSHDPAPAGFPGRPLRPAHGIQVWLWIPGLVTLALLGSAGVVLGIVGWARDGDLKNLTSAAGLLPLLLVGAAGLYILAARRSRRRKLLRDGISTTGEVTWHRLTQLTRLTTQTVDYRFTDRSGNRHIAQFVIGGRFNPDPPRYEVGDPIEVIYLAGMPERSTPAIDLFTDARA